MILTIFKLLYFTALVNTILYSLDGKSRRIFYVNILRKCIRILEVTIRTKSLSTRNANTLRNYSALLSANNILILIFCFSIPLIVLLSHLNEDLLDGSILNTAIAAALVVLGSIIVLAQTFSVLLSFIVIAVQKYNRK